MGKLKTSLLLSYISIASISAAVITPALPQIEQTYALDHGALEWVISIFLLGYVIGQLIYAPIVNRFGRLNALRSGLIVNLVGVVLCIASVWLLDYNLLLLGRFVTALGTAAGLSCTFILLNEILPKEEAKHAMSFAIVSFTAGIGLAVTLGGLITQYWHWQDCFVLLLAHGFIMLGLTWVFPETLKKPQKLRPLIILSSYWNALKSIELIVFSLGVGFVSAVAYCYSAAAPLYAQLTLNLTPDVYGYWNLLNMLGMLASGFAAAHLIKKYGALHLIWLAFLFTPLCLTSLIFVAISEQANTLWFFVTTSFLYLFSGLIFPAASFFASNAIEDKASASSMMSFINMASAMMAVVIMGYLPFRPIVAFTTVICVFFILSLLLILGYVRQSRTSDRL